jgi:hypothetical protein
MNYAKTLFTVFFMLVSASAYAQTSLEYPGGPHAGTTDAEIQKLGAWAKNVQLELSRVEAKISNMTDDTEIKRVLLDKMKQVAGDSGLRPGDLLLRQSLYAGVVLSDIIDQEGLKKGPTPGEVYQQVKILKKAIAMAKDYYVSDQVYVDGLLKHRAEVHFNNKLVEFGVRLSRFIIKQSTSMLPLDATASYGMMKWALGVLDRKLLEDDRNVAFASTITYLNSELQAYPEMDLMPSDVDAILKIRDLKSLAKQIFKEIEDTQKSLIKE